MTTNLFRVTADVFSAPGYDGIRHGFYGRNGGVSTGAFASLNCSYFAGDDADNVTENRQRVATDLRAKRIVTCRQVHGRYVQVVGDDDDKTHAADGIVTADTDIAIGILAADCAPVLFADPAARVIGVAHAGWQGALAGVTDAVIAAMTKLGAKPARITAAIGPAIQAASYEIGNEFTARFHAESPLPCEDCFLKNVANKQHFDLPKYVTKRLTHAGITTIQTLTDDTYTNPENYFSYRRNCHESEHQYGRQIAAIMLSS